MWFENTLCKCLPTKAVKVQVIWVLVFCKICLWHKLYILTLKYTVQPILFSYKLFLVEFLHLHTINVFVCNELTKLQPGKHFTKVTALVQNWNLKSHVIVHVAAASSTPIGFISAATCSHKKVVKSGTIEVFRKEKACVYLADMANFVNSENKC